MGGMKRYCHHSTLLLFYRLVLVLIFSLFMFSRNGVTGLDLEMSDVTVEPLYDVAAMGHLSVDEFMAALPSLDAAMQERCDAAAAKGQVLRYAATIDVKAATLQVGLLAVDAQGPLGTLMGSDNLVEVHSEAVYSESPLVVRGAGAGAASTASGALADMLDLAFVAVE